MGVLSIEIGGVELRDYIRQETIRINSSGSSLAATCAFEVEDRLGQAPWINILEKQDIIITDADGPTRLFGGVVAHITEEHDGPLRKWTIRGSDYTILLDSNLAALGWSVGLSDADVIVAIFAGSPIDALEAPAGYVQELRADMGDIAFAGVTLREALQDLCRKTGGSYYVDFYTRLHYFAVDEGEDAPFGLSTEPDMINTFPYGKYKRARDATKLINRVQIANYGGIEVWRDDLASQAEPWGIQEGVVRDRNITSVADAEAYGDWILSRHAWPKGEPECVCWRPGLRAGMRIQLANSVWGFGPTWYSIRKAELRCMGGTGTTAVDPQYEIKLSMGLNDAAGRPDVEPNPDYSPAPPYPEYPEEPITGETVEVLAEDGTISKVYYTTDFLDAVPTWVGSSTGIPASRFARMVLDPWETDRAVICGSAGLYMNDAVKNGGAWSQIFSEADFEALLGLAITNFAVRDVHFSITVKGSIWALVFFHDATMAAAVKDDLAVVHSHDYGVTWAISNRCIGLISTNNIWNNGCDLEVSQHNPDLIWYAVARIGIGTGDPWFLESVDGGDTFAFKSECEDYADPSYHIHVPYDNNPDDLIIWLYGATGTFGTRLAYSINRGTTWAERSDGTAICYPARGGHNLITNNQMREHVYAANANEIGGHSLNFHFSKDEGGTWPVVARPSVPSAFSILPQAVPNMVLYLGERSRSTPTVDLIAVRSSQDNGATWIDRTGNLQTLMVADGMINEVWVVTITPDWLLPYGSEGEAELPEHEADPAAHHDPVTLGPGSDPALTLAGQQLTLADVLTPAEHTAIGNGAPHHAPATAIDGQHTFAGQVLSGVDAAVAQKGHIQLTGQLGGTAASPDVRGLRETGGPTNLTMGAAADGSYLRRSGATVVGDDIEQIAGIPLEAGLPLNTEGIYYNAGAGEWQYAGAPPPGAHAATHEDGGGDEISVEGLSGLLDDLQDAGWIDGVPLEAGPPQDGEVMVYDDYFGMWVYQTPGAGGAVEIQEDDVFVADASKINFEGGGGKVIDEGGGKVTVDITGSGGGAPNNAKYVVSEADGTLTNEIVKPYMANYDPDVPLAIPGAYDDEFDDDVIAGWTTPGDEDANFDMTQSAGTHRLSESIMHGYLLMQGAYGADGAYTFYKAFTPNITQAFTVVCKVDLGYCGSAADTFRFCIRGQDANHFYEIAVGRTWVSGVLCGFVVVYKNGGAATTGNSAVGPAGSVYLMITHDGAKKLSAFYSVDGRGWIPLEIDRNMSNFTSFTQLAMRTGSDGVADGIAAIDFIRYFATEGQYKIGKDV